MLRFDAKARLIADTGVHAVCTMYVNGDPKVTAAAAAGRIGRGGELSLSRPSMGCGTPPQGAAGEPPTRTRVMNVTTTCNEA